MEKVIEIKCPLCHGSLWVDVEKKEVISHEKSHKKNMVSFDELLIKEKEKKEKSEQRFKQAQELESAKKKKAEEIFKKSLSEENT
jgi:uncharacterized protein YbaR (Trm112 family)